MSRHTPTRQKRTDTLPPAEVHDLLSHHRRIAILDVLDANGGELKRADLIDRVADRENPDVTRTGVSTSLYHNHLPKLEDAGVLVTHDGYVGLTLLAAPVLHQIRAGHAGGHSSRRRA